MLQGGQDADGRVHAGEDVDERDAHTDRSGPVLSIARSGHAHNAAHALDEVVVAGTIRIGALLPEAGDGAIDQARVYGAKVLIAEAVAGEGARTIVLDQDVADRGLPTQGFGAFGDGEIQGDGALVAVHALE